MTLSQALYREAMRVAAGRGRLTHMDRVLGASVRGVLAASRADAKRAQQVGRELVT